MIEEFKKRLKTIEGIQKNFNIVGMSGQGNKWMFNPTATRHAAATPTPPPPVCPSTLHVQFSGVGFECGCSLFGPGSGTSFLITDPGDTNSFSTAMNLGNYGFAICGDCGMPVQHQLWISGSGAGITPHVLISYWNDASDCSGGPTGINFAEYFGMVMVLLSGTYYLVAYINQSIIFHGTTTDLSVPFVNTFGCNLSFTDYSGVLEFCMFHGILTPTMNVVGHGGIATVTIP